MGWTKRETCINFYDLIILYLCHTRADNHKDTGLETAKHINELTMKLINDEKWHTKSLNLKKLIELYKAFDKAYKHLYEKGTKDPNLVKDKLF